MSSLRNEVAYYKEDLRDGISWVAFWKEGRSWRSTNFYTELDNDAREFLLPRDIKELEEIQQKDPNAVVLNGEYCGFIGADMNVSQLVDGIRHHYESKSSCNISNFIDDMKPYDDKVQEANNENQETQEVRETQQQELMERALEAMGKQTPIEIMLQVDDEGKTTAKALYEFLELDTSHYSRWCKKNILENSFAEENIDYLRFAIDGKTPTGGIVKRDDYKLTASFAKKLAMSCQNERGEQAREYFIKVEEKLKKVASKKVVTNDEQAKMMRAKAMLLNAQNRTFKTIMQSIDNKKLSPIAVEVFGLKTLESIFGVDVGNYLPEVEKTYTASEVGAMLGITANKVGKIANANGLKTAENGIFTLNKSRYSNKEVESFRYNQKGIEAIRQCV